MARPAAVATRATLSSRMFMPAPKRRNVWARCDRTRASRAIRGVLGPAARWELPESRPEIPASNRTHIKALHRVTPNPNRGASMASIRTTLITGAAVVAAAAGGATFANAASSGSSSAGAQQGRHTVNGHSEQALTGATADSVRKAALAKVPGTVERIETNVDGNAPYEAHITKSDGTEVEVQINKDFSVAAVNQMGDHDGDHG